MRRRHFMPLKGIQTGLQQGAEAIREVTAETNHAQYAYVVPLHEEETPEMWRELTAEEVDRLTTHYQAAQPTKLAKGRLLVANYERKFQGAESTT